METLSPTEKKSTATHPAETFTLQPGELTLADCRRLIAKDYQLQLAESCFTRINQAADVVTKITRSNKTVYGINTGFGKLANTQINDDQLIELQTNILLSHAVGVGDAFPNIVVNLIMLLKINSLARGYSGIRLITIDALLGLYNHKLYPIIPCKGSVGASGDLAPLAHMSLPLIGIGNISYQGNQMQASAGLNSVGQAAITLAAKEGLALINGTQVSTALALRGLFLAENCFIAALLAGALSTDAIYGTDVPCDERIHAVRGYKEQSAVARILKNLLKGSEIREQHRNCNKVQDPYSFRCRPQVMGAVLRQLLFAADTLHIEANCVSDNPLVFVEDEEVLSGGNFHAEPVAMAADNMAIAIAEMGSLSERRMAILIDPSMSSLPPFLVDNAGLNSGFMMAQVTAAALVSENKCLSFPASVDSIPTSANQEDHVSMATHAARRLTDMTENLAVIIAIELLAACQGIDYHDGKKTSPLLEPVRNFVREYVPFYDKDRYFSSDIEVMTEKVVNGDFNKFISENLFASLAEEQQG